MKPGGQAGGQRGEWTVLVTCTIAVAALGKMGWGGREVVSDSGGRGVFRRPGKERWTP